ncbi:MAG: hypothetical protein U1E65_32180 [Myxococcota bacterium]
MKAFLVVCMGVLLVPLGCDGGRRIPTGNPGTHSDASTHADAHETSDAEAQADAALDSGAPASDAGAADASAFDAGSSDAGSSDAGGCAFPPAQGSSQPCCPSRGIDACGLDLECTALDGRTQPICYPYHSRNDGQSCTSDVLCVSGNCGASNTCEAGPRFDSVEKILVYLEGKTLLEVGASMPPYPFGLSENVNNGPASTCFTSITIHVQGGVLHNQTVLAQISGAPNQGDTGVCVHSSPQQMVQYDSTSFAITHLRGNGACFDIDASYTILGTEGRGRIAADGSSMDLEIFYAGQATHHRCADGDVGTVGVVVSGVPLAGNAVQHFDLR